MIEQRRTKVSHGKNPEIEEKGAEGKKPGKVQRTKYRGICLIGENYYIDYYGNGKRHRKVVGPNLDYALEEKTRRRRKNRKGKYHIVERMENTTFGQLMKLYKEEGEGKDYILQFEATYLEQFGDWKLSQISRSDLFEFRDKVKSTPKQRGGWNYTLKCKCRTVFEGHSKKDRCPKCSGLEDHKVIKKEKSSMKVTVSTVNRALAGLRKLFNFAMSKEYLEESPFPKDPKSGLFYSEKGTRGRKKFYTEAEVIKIIEALPKDPWYLRAMTITAYLSGMRAGEMLNLKRETGLNLQAGEIFLTMTKAGEPQAVKMQDVLVEFFREWMKIHPHSEYVFCKSDGGPLTHDDYYKPFKKALEAIGKNGKGWNFHTLRHTTGTQLHLKGADLIAIKDQLRHSDIRITTDFYVGNDSAYQKAQIEKLSNGCFKEFLDESKDNSTPVKNALKKEAVFGTPQEVLPIATA